MNYESLMKVIRANRSMCDGVHHVPKREPDELIFV